MTFAWTSFNINIVVSNSDGLHLVAMASNLIAITFAWTSFNTKSLVSNGDGLHLVAMASN